MNKEELEKDYRRTEEEIKTLKLNQFLYEKEIERIEKEADEKYKRLSEISKRIDKLTGWEV